MQWSRALYTGALEHGKGSRDKSNRIVGAEILQRLRNHGYSSPENDTWVHTVAADPSCSQDGYQPVRHSPAAGGIAPGSVRDQHFQLQHAPAHSNQEIPLDHLSCVRM